MRVLITGATGFIGSWTVDVCLRQGMELAALTISDRRQHVLERWNNKVLPLVGNLANPPWDAIRGFAPDSCLHAAWITTPGDYLDSSANHDFLLWSKALFKGLVQIGVSHLVGVGSCAEYTLPIISPQPSLYARCKNELRESLQELAKEAAIKWAWPRLFYPYGPGEAPERLCSAAIRNWMMGQVFKLNCPNACKDYIFVRDVANGLAQILQHRGTGIFDIGTGVAIPLRTVAEELATYMGCRDLLVFGNNTDRLGTLVADPTRLMTLHWKASTSLPTGLALSVEAFRDAATKPR